MKTVDVSLLATNYNNGKYLNDFFKSIENSTVKPREIIFVDDGSTDDSLRILKSYENLGNLKLIKFHKNKGRSVALNTGKKNCTSKYTLIIDPDDVLLPERIEKQFNFMENNPEIDVLGGNVIYFNDKTKKKLNKSNFPIKNILEVYKKGQNGVLQPTVIIKTKIFKLYNYKPIVPGQDYELFARMVKAGYKFANLPDILNKMRVHPNSAVSKLSLNSIKNIYKQRDKIFNTKTKKIVIITYYLHLKCYRIGMLSNFIVKKYLFFILSSLFYPQKIFKRFLK